MGSLATERTICEEDRTAFQGRHWETLEGGRVLTAWEQMRVTDSEKLSKLASDPSK